MSTNAIGPSNLQKRLGSPTLQLNLPSSLGTTSTLSLGLGHEPDARLKKANLQGSSPGRFEADFTAPMTSHLAASFTNKAISHTTSSNTTTPHSMDHEHAAQQLLSSRVFEGICDGWEMPKIRRLASIFGNPFPLPANRFAIHPLEFNTP